MIFFKDYWVLWAVPLVVLAWILMQRRTKDAGFKMPSYELVVGLGGSFREQCFKSLKYIRLIALILLIVGLARPQMTTEYKVRKDAIGIILAIDLSSTMLAEDLELGPTGLAPLAVRDGDAKRRNRLDAVKEVAKDFIKSRPDDLIGVVAFGSEAFVVCPPTFDREWLLQSVDRLKIGLIKDGTALGSGVLASLNSLKDVHAKSTAILLLSDGINNAGEVPPLVAAKSARAFGIKIYTIGIVSRGQTPYPTVDSSGYKIYKDVRIDVNEDILRKMADTTGGSYFRATDMGSLRASYQEIDRLERVRMEDKRYAQGDDLFPFFVIPALILLLTEIIVGGTLLQRIP